MEILDDIEKYVKFLPKGIPDEEKEKDDGHLGKKRNRNKNKNKKENNKEEKKEPAKMSELQMKIKEKIASFNTNKGKRTQKKEKRN